MSNFGIFYSLKYLKYFESIKNVKIKLFTFQSGAKKAILPHYIQNNVIFGLRYGGIVTSSIEREFYRNVRNKFLEYCVNNSIKSVKLRVNPFQKSIQVGNQILREFIAYINLTIGLKQLSSNFSGGHLKRLRKSLGNGLSYHVTNEKKHLIQFYKLYSDDMSLKGLKFHNFEYFDRLYCFLKGSLRFYCVKREDKIIAISMLLESKPNLHMLFGAMSDKGYQLYAKHYLIYNVIRNYKLYNYGKIILGTGVEGKNDPIYQFKQGFTKDRCFCYTYEHNLG